MSERLLLFGRTIRCIRNEKKMSQEQLADLCGLHRTYVSDVELGKRNVSLENIEKMADALDVKISDIFRRVEESEGF